MNRQGPTVVHGMRSWSTDIYDCFTDEETCWWTYWCPLLVQGRTWCQFQVCPSSSVIMITCSTLAVLILTYMADVFYFNLALICLCCGYPFLLARRRGDIRQKLRIQGNFCDDCTAHCFCSSCATAQESREAYAAGMPNLDLCSGDVLEHPVSSIASTNPLVDGTDEADADIELGRGGGTTMTSFAHTAADMLFLSKTSKYILWLMGTIAFFVSVGLLMVGKKGQVLVLFAVFAQPILVLYYLYWKPLRTTVAIDYIIKLFAVGFFMTTMQAVVIEELLQVLLLLIVSPVLADAVGLAKNEQFGDQGGAGSSSSTSASVSASSYDTRLLSNIGRRLTSGSSSGSTSSQLLHQLLQETYTTLFDPNANANANGDPNFSSSGNDGGAADPVSNLPKLDIPALIRENWGLTLVACFIMAFLVAAGVEETLKNFIVRCYRFGAPLKDPYTITMFFLAGALGFATSENLSYVFNSNDGSSPIDGTSQVVGELTVLLLRVLMPVHLFCAVLQAANVSEIVSGKTPDLSLWRVLLPAIILHGFFDFSLFLLAIFAFAEGIDSTGYEIFTLIVSLCIGLIGLKYAHTRFKQVTQDYDLGFHQLNDSTEHSTLSIGVSSSSAFEMTPLHGTL